MSVDKWDHRQLCSDGGCIGVIGPDGTCKMCGRAAPNWGDERKRGLIDAPDDGDEEDDDDDDGAAEAPVEAKVRRAPVSGGGGAWNERRLCSDGGCIGVLGDDGKCKLCGKQGDAAAYADHADGEPDDDEEYEDDDEEAGDDAEPASADDDGNDEYEDDEDEDDEDDEEDDDGEEADDATDDDRKLCPDGACVGVIGPDGKCKICRKEAE